MVTNTKYNIILGSTVRSRNGCSNCKKSKKKCDENFPICGLCGKKNIACNYENFRTTKVESKGKVHKPTKAKPESNVKSSQQSVSSSSRAVDNQLSPITAEMFQGLSPMINHFYHYENSMYNSPKIEEIDEIGDGESKKPEDIDKLNDEIEDLKMAIDNSLSPLSLFPYHKALTPNQIIEYSDLTSLTVTSSFNLYLDDIGMQFLQYFEEKVSYLLCIDKNSSNYFLKTFLQISLTEESISNALACWGGVFKSKDGLNNKFVKRHLDKSITLFKNYSVNDDFQCYIVLCYYQIMLGIQICNGDVKNWWNIYMDCYELINGIGGIKKLLQKYQYSNDIKWLVSNFQYHDILCSDAFVEGTKFDMEEYDLNFINYGVDPYQGCNNEIIALIGDILNAKAKLDYKDVYQLNELYEFFTKKIEDCGPIDSQINLLHDRAKENYLLLFRLYKVCAKLILLMYFKRIPLCATDIQLLVIEGIDYIEQLINSNLVSCLTFAFLMVGINILRATKLKFLTLIQKIMPIYTVGNLTRVKHIVMTYWERNNNGDMILDWTDITKELNWRLSLT